MSRKTYSYNDNKRISENKEEIFHLFPIENKNTELSFNGERLSSDGGLLLPPEVNWQVGLIKRINSRVFHNHYHRYIDHPIKELAGSRPINLLQPMTIETTEMT